MELLEGNRVLEHTLMRNKVLDGDNHVLHVQVRPGCMHVCGVGNGWLMLAGMLIFSAQRRPPA
jgi:hypothetical protein